MILLDRTAANADGANYLLIKNNWQAAAKNNNSLLVGKLQTVQRLSWLDRWRNFMGTLLQAAGAPGFIQGNIAAGDEGLVHPLNKQRVASVVNHGKHYRHLDLSGFFCTAAAICWAAARVIV